MANPMTSAHQVIHAIAAVVVAVCHVLSTKDSRVVGRHDTDDACDYSDD